MEYLIGVLVGILLMLGLVIWSLAGEDPSKDASDHWPEEKKDKASENNGW